MRCDGNVSPTTRTNILPWRVAGVAWKVWACERPHVCVTGALSQPKERNLDDELVWRRRAASHGGVATPFHHVRVSRRQPGRSGGDRPRLLGGRDAPLWSDGSRSLGRGGFDGVTPGGRRRTRDPTAPPGGN